MDFDPAAEKPGQGPVQFVHVDQSYMDAIESVKFYCPEEAQDLFRHRFQIINVSPTKSNP